MGLYVFKLPDVGEGTAEAEIVAWHVKVGDVITEDQNLVDVMTDKATVEMTSPVSGKVVKMHGEPGEMAPVGAPLVELEVEGAGNAKAGEASKAAPSKAEEKKETSLSPTGGEGKGEGVSPPAKTAPPHPSPLPHGGRGSDVVASPRTFGDKPIASPAVRARAEELGIKLQYITPTGPAGRITHEDLEAFVASGGQVSTGRTSGYAKRDGINEVKVIGLRRKIAEKMQESKRRIPHYAYVDEVDMTELESLRAHLNKTKQKDQPKLTVLPFFMRALVKVLPDYPQINARFDDEAGVVHRYQPVHIGIATQTANGLIGRASCRERV